MEDYLLFTRLLQLSLFFMLTVICLSPCRSQNTSSCDKGKCIQGECVNGTCVCKLGWGGLACDHCTGRVRYVYKHIHSFLKKCIILYPRKQFSSIHHDMFNASPSKFPLHLVSFMFVNYRHILQETLPVTTPKLSRPTIW